MNDLPLILVLGRNGQVGSELVHAMAPLGRVVSWGRSEANLATPSLLGELVAELGPDVIVNAAAYTAVDKSETERELAMKINGEAAAVLGKVAKESDALLVHYSTDYVFDGTKAGPYREDDLAKPVNYYGQTKLEGEQGIIASGCRSLIFRTTWVYSWHGNNFLKTMLRLGRERPEVAVVNDQFGAPTWSRMIAQATSLAVAQCLVQPDRFVGGIYNLSAAGRTTWHEFATEIFRLARSIPGLSSQLKLTNVRAIPTTDFPTPATRPANSELCHEKLLGAFRLALPDWRQSLKEMMGLYPGA